MVICITKKLVKFFGDVLVLDELNLKIPKGISGFIGPNGAGKTTTINVLLGLLKPDSGEARIFGLDCWRNSYEIRSRIGVLHEYPSYPKNFTGMRFLELVAKLHKIYNPKKKASIMLKLVGLYDARNRFIKGYSAGMLRRLGIAQALIGEPEFVILDEPTANLDPASRLKILKIIKEYHKDNDVNFLISTHILSELEKICNWVSIISNGRVIDQGFISDLRSKYSTNICRVESSDPNILAEELKKTDLVKHVWVDRNFVYCKVDELDHFYKMLPVIATKVNVSIKSLQMQYSTLDKIYEGAVKNDET
ncbi:MAG: ABC transporter ATP-binding protein [Candidatus Asgardarchaeia archaeon]